ncbi:MAG: hypothetical protein GY930_12470 [bacterium]|nr:hypothetical protein [bacterium]
MAGWVDGTGNRFPDPFIVISIISIAKLMLAASLTMGAQTGDAPGQDSRVDLGVVYEHPADAVGQELCFYVQLDGLQESWNPFGTRFVPDRFVKARVWGDRQRLWDRFDYHNPVGEIFVPLDSRLADKLIGAQRYQRLLCVGSVRYLRCGRPWIEVTRIYTARKSVAEGSLLHVIRGAELHARKAFSMARDEYARAITPELPKAVRLELEGFIKVCRAE